MGSQESDMTNTLSTEEQKGADPESRAPAEPRLLHSSFAPPPPSYTTFKGAQNTKQNQKPKYMIHR